VIGPEKNVARRTPRYESVCLSSPDKRLFKPRSSRGFLLFTELFAARSDLGEYWPTRLVAKAAENRLSISPINLM
jgi:hypothetical protein